MNMDTKPKSLEELYECMEEMEIRLESKFEALQHFTIQELRQLRDSNNVDSLNDTLESLKSEFETFRSVSTSTPVETSKRKSAEGSVSFTLKRSKPSVKKSTSVNDEKMVATPLVISNVYKTIEDVHEPTLRQLLEKHSNFGHQSGLLSPLQNAYFLMHFNEKIGHFSAKRSVVEELIRCGVRDHIWEPNFVPDGARHGFYEYLREKTKNEQKKKLSAEAITDFIAEYTME